MHRPVGHIVELIGPDGTVGLGVCQCLGQATGLVHEVIGILIRRRFHQSHFSTVSAQGIDLVAALVGRHDDDGSVAECVVDHGQTDPRVAGGAFHHGAARPELAPFFCIPDDTQCRPVFDRAPGIHKFRLAQDFTTRGIRNTIESDQRRGSHAVDQAESPGTHCSMAAICSAWCSLARGSITGSSLPSRISLSL